MLFRQKEQFSDGVGYDWIDGLKAHAAAVIDDTMFAFREHRFPYNTPATKEVCVCVCVCGGGGGLVYVCVCVCVCVLLVCVYVHICILIYMYTKHTRTHAHTHTRTQAYYVRSIFENFYPQQTCIETVSGGFSVACSTAKAVEWDAEWMAAAASGSAGDQSGRAVKGVHDAATKCF